MPRFQVQYTQEVELIEEVDADSPEQAEELVLTGTSQGAPRRAGRVVQMVQQYVVALVRDAGQYPAGYILGIADTHDEAVALRTRVGVLAAFNLGLIEISITPDLAA